MKNYLIIFLFLIAGTAFAQDKSLAISTLPEIIKHNPCSPDPYRIDLQLTTTSQKHYQIQVAVDIDEGTWFASPYSAHRYKGYFRVDLPENEFVQLTGSFEETPPSTVHYDKWDNQMGHIVTVDTKYTYDIATNSKEDFKILGVVRFVIEPKCTLEEVPFSISRESGKMSIQRYPKLQQGVCNKKI